MGNMKVIIPAAGIGSRLRPQTHTIPKALLHVAGKPILAHILDSVVSLKPEEITIVTGFLGDMVREYVQENYSVKTRFVNQEELLGLGYAVYLALEENSQEPVLIILGDTIVETDMAAFVSSGENVLGLMSVDDPQRFGIADVNSGKVTRLVEKPEKPESDLAVIGLYYVSNADMLRRKLEQLISNDSRTKGEIQLTDALQEMIKEGIVFGAYTVDGWFDCGKRETLIETNRHFLEKLPPPAKIEGSIVLAPSYIAPSAKIEDSIIGPYVSISEGAIVQNSIIRNSIIGYHAEVRKALLNNSLIGHRAVVSDNFKELNVGDSSEIGCF